jgi:hypothetical protein
VGRAAGQDRQDPVDVLTRPRRKARLPRVPRWETVESVLQQCTDVREKALVALMCFGGLRRSDIVGNDGAYRPGGRVVPKPPDPRRLSAKLKARVKVNVGDHDDETDDVPVRLTRGEIVMNRPAATAHAKQLNEWNEQGRRAMGGMGVGPGGPRSAGRGGRAGGFGVTGRRRDERHSSYT